ncbi:MAG: hypothetical protein WDZ68_00515 [Candidatus Paceibacterota bacterium]
MKLPENILLIDKPIGITSFAVIRRLQRELQSTTCRAFLLSAIRGVCEACDKDVLNDTAQEQTSNTTKKCAKRKVRMGHAGTLDPLASGLMIIGIGSGTKKLTEYVKLPKEYIAEILLGERRSTGDMEGEVLETADVPSLDEHPITNVLMGMIGKLTLEVSAYSAIKKDGVPMYKRARIAEKKGEQISDLPKREMEVIEAKYLSHECIPPSETRTGQCIVHVRFAVGSGTYIRSLAEELGRRLGYPATLKGLRRTKIGNFSIADAETL